tara:strand:- start:2632 stop:4143 length:1512 start_codon:yes stop_codon:yes gene_type:complete
MLLGNKKYQELLSLTFTMLVVAAIMILGSYLTSKNQIMLSILIYSSLILYSATIYKKIYSYIIKEHLVPFLLCMFAMMFVLLAQYLIKHIDKFLGKGLDVMVLIEMIYYSMAAVIALAVPMAILVCTLMAFGRLSSDNEIVAMKSSGIKYYSLIVPPVILSVLVAVAMIYFNNWILPDMNYKSKKLLSEISTKNLEIIFEPKQLNTQVEGFTIYFESMDDNIFKDVTINETNKYNNEIIKTIISEQAYTIDSFDPNKIIILLKNGVLYQDLDNDKFQTIKFKTNQIKMDLNQFSFSNNQRRGDRELNFQAIKDTIDWHSNLIDESQNRIKKHIKRIDQKAIIAYPYHFLSDYYLEHRKSNLNLKNEDLENYFDNTQNAINKEKKRIDGFNKQINKFLVEMHKKFSLPIACIVFILVGAPLGVTTRKGKFSINIAISLTFFLIYWAFLIAGENFADKGSINPALAMWMPNIILLTVGIYFNYRIDKGKKILTIPYIKFLKKIKK